MFDAMNLMKKAQEMQQQMQQMQEELGRKQITADAGGGMVQATVNGKLELVKLHIDKEKVDVNDTELLEDVIIAAVSAAQAKAADNMKSEMQKRVSKWEFPQVFYPDNTFSVGVS